MVSIKDVAIGVYNNTLLAITKPKRIDITNIRTKHRILIKNPCSYIKYVNGKAFALFSIFYNCSKLLHNGIQKIPTIKKILSIQKIPSLVIDLYGVYIKKDLVIQKININTGRCY